MRSITIAFLGAALVGGVIAEPHFGRAAVSSARGSGTAGELSAVDLSALDMSADACTDFYQRACGGFIARTKVSSDQPKLPLAIRSSTRTLKRISRSFSRIRPRRIRNSAD